jgi:hypothetical protein
VILVFRCVDALAVAARQALAATHLAAAFSANWHAVVGGRTSIVARPAVGGAGLEIDALPSARGRSVTAFEGALAVDARFAGGARLSAVAAVGDVVVGIDTALPACELVARAGELAFAVRTRLVRGASKTAMPAVASIGFEVDAVTTARLERVVTAELTRPLLASGAAMRRRRARYVAASAMLHVARSVDACPPTIGLSGVARIGALTLGADLTGAAGVRARAAVTRVARRVDALSGAVKQRRVAGGPALAHLARHGGSQLARTRLAALAAVRHVAQSVDAARTASQGAIAAREGALALHAGRGGPGRGDAGGTASPAVCRVRLERDAFARTSRLASFALRAVGGAS